MEYLEFWHRFQKAEQRAKVFEIKTIGFFLYPMLRTRLYYQLAQDLRIFSDPHPASETKSEKVVLESIQNLIPKSKTIVIPFVRKVAGIDVYSQSVLEQHPNAQVLEVIDDEGPLDLERIKGYSQKRYEDQVYELMLKEKVRDVRDRWAKMAEVFEEELGVGLGKFAQFPNWLIRRYVAECLGFKQFFLNQGTKNLIIVNAYSHPSVVVGAKQAGVRVTEIQHGFVSEFHPAYSYPKIRIQSAPDKFLVWGEFWKNAAKYPKGMSAKVLGPSSLFLRQRAEVSSKTRVPNSILFTSQGALGPVLFQEAILWAQLLPEYRITYRLHPNEDLASYQTHEVPENLTLSHKSPGFLDLLGEHEYLVGGFSTTLYEGAAFGLKVIVLPIAGFENALPAIAANDMVLAKKIETKAQLIELLESSKPAKNPYAYYAKDINLKEALRAGF